MWSAWCKIRFGITSSAVANANPPGSHPRLPARNSGAASPQLKPRHRQTFHHPGFLPWRLSELGAFALYLYLCARLGILRSSQHLAMLAAVRRALPLVSRLLKERNRCMSNKSMQRLLYFALPTPQPSRQSESGSGSDGCACRGSRSGRRSNCRLALNSSRHSFAVFFCAMACEENVINPKLLSA